MQKRALFEVGEYYHVFNRGIEKRPTFTDKREFVRATQTIKYYRYIDPPIRLSHFLKLERDNRELLSKRLHKQKQHIAVLAYCLMPNHFHFLLKQTCENGISKFIANFTNSYTKYFNTKHQRVGPLFQGLFKAVRIEDDDQFVHVSRYIHLNPSTAFLIEKNALHLYEWSSYPDYLQGKNGVISEVNDVLNFFSKRNTYENFVLDQADYARQLSKIKHLLFE